ncbi:hypothetical protein H696_03758 [Fonticula alba]|uniref:Selenoprotein O n=1 Tax=Fonticula alba TaxID=691883 RepID=A0A058Z5C1_FONAL|nr:hypothetical protein H696_03758 [Fonticula alba]KCV69326.1 hypothetical protein H696_03758 [Fonticula alba]|eukprot:XP_009495891.1 hypothetical protein H696_03758 [Fonticula alba]
MYLGARLGRSLRPSPLPLFCHSIMPRRSLSSTPAAAPPAAGALHFRNVLLRTVPVNTVARGKVCSPGAAVRLSHAAGENPVAGNIGGQTFRLDLGQTVYSLCAGTGLTAPRVIAQNIGDLAEIGLRPEDLKSPQAAALLSLSEPSPDSAPEQPGPAPHRNLTTGAEPHAHCYSGYQFGYHALQLGDGRAISLGQVQGCGAPAPVAGSIFAASKPTPLPSDPPSVFEGLVEVQVKGAGLTPYSRQGDGRAVYRSSVREFLCSAFMRAVGVASTGAPVLMLGEDFAFRQPEPNSGAVFEICCGLMRTAAPSHLRIGSFEALAFSRKTPAPAGSALLRTAILQDPGMDEGLTDLERQAVRYVRRLGVDRADGLAGAPGPEPPLRLTGTPESPAAAAALDRVLARVLVRAAARRNARLVAQWQAVGFIHGVLNTDNVSIHGLTIDYGPFSFVSQYARNASGNLSDSSGVYAFDCQPDVVRRNVLSLAAHLRRSLFPQVDPAPGADDLAALLGNLPAEYGVEAHLDGEELLGVARDTFDRHFRQEEDRLHQAKFGLVTAVSEDDRRLFRDFYHLLQETGSDMTTAFRLLACIPSGFESGQERQELARLAQLDYPEALLAPAAAAAIREAATSAPSPADPASVDAMVRRVLLILKHSRSANWRVEALVADLADRLASSGADPVRPTGTPDLVTYLLETFPALADDRAATMTSLMPGHTLGRMVAVLQTHRHLLPAHYAPEDVAHFERLFDQLAALPDEKEALDEAFDRQWLDWIARYQARLGRDQPSSLTRAEKIRQAAVRIIPRHHTLQRLIAASAPLFEERPAGTLFSVDVGQSDAEPSFVLTADCRPELLAQYQALLTRPFDMPSPELYSGVEGSSEAESTGRTIAVGWAAYGPPRHGLDDMRCALSCSS